MNRVANLTLQSSCPVSGLEWLRQHDPLERPKHRRWERFKERRKAKQQSRRQQRRVDQRYAPPLLKAV